MTNPYQAHSETSIEAAQLGNFSPMENKVLSLIEKNQVFGMTCDEISQKLNITTGTIAARLRSLELSEQIIKTNMTRPTRYNRKANVYVHRDLHREYMGTATVKEATELEKVKAENVELKKIIEELRGKQCQQ
jgi:DNA-binding CsgD family transcriptional regulator